MSRYWVTSKENGIEVMELGAFTPTSAGEGDRIQAQQMAGKAMIAHVKSRKEGIKTKFSPDGGVALFFDIVDLTSGTIYLDVMWMNETITDQLAGSVGQFLPLKVVFQPSSSGGNPYLKPEMLEGSELEYANSWARNNPNAFDNERANRATVAVQQGQQPPQFNSVPSMGQAPLPTAQAPMPVASTPAPAPQAPVAAPVASAAPVAAAGGVDAPTGVSPEMLALLEMVKAGKIPGM